MEATGEPGFVQITAHNLPALAEIVVVAVAAVAVALFVGTGRGQSLSRGEVSDTARAFAAAYAKEDSRALSAARSITSCISGSRDCMALRTWAASSSEPPQSLLWKYGAGVVLITACRASAASIPCMTVV